MRLLNTFGVVGLIACSGNKSEPAANSAPIFTSVEITPAEGITTSTELLCVAIATDDDNDALEMNYQWTDADGTVLSDTDSLTLSPDTVHPRTEITCTVTASDAEVSVTTAISVTVENTVPTVSNVSISPETVLVDSLLECSFDAVDLDGEELSVSYSWTQNGTEVGTEASLQLDAENFSDGDVIVCVVTVTDGYEGIASDSAEVVIGNTAPVIGSTTITPENPYSYETLTCTANDVIDLEGDAVSISYEWSIDGEIQTETSNMLPGPFLVGALIACRTTPNDGKVDGGTVEDDTTINNTAPTLDTVSISPMVNIEANTFMTCEATASDVDNEELTITYAWTKSDGTILGTEGELQLDATMVSPGDSIACTATVTDPHGASDSLGQSSSVINTNPVVDSAAEITGDATTTSTLTCAATFSDLNDGTLNPTFSWTNQSGTQLSTTNSYTIAASETETGDELTCTASVMDADGATLSSSATVTIANTLPTLTGVSLSPNPVISTDSLTCSVDSTADIDEDAVTILYEWSVDGVLQSETSNMLPGPLLVGTLISCTATPNDGKENGVVDTADITVRNTAPVVDAVSLDASPIYTDGIVTATVALSDIDAEQTVTANYAWHVIDASNGGTDTEVQTGTENTLDGSFFNKNDQVYVVVTPNDGVENGSSVISSPLTIANSEPTGITASVTSSDMFYNDSTLTCSATASDIDPEDAVLTYTYAWSTGDTGADLVLSGSMMPGSELTCTATATDSSGAAISVDVMETLMNRAPTVDSVTLPQDVTAETTSILCDATGSDLDGETPTLTYAWTINGQTHTETSNTLTDSFAYQDVIVCTVTSADATGTGSSMDATTTVLNTAPVVDSVALTPATVYTNDTITATSVLSDVDAAQAGSLTANYEWFVNGASVQNGTSNTLDASLFDKDDQVYVVVTANDGVEDGAPVTSSSVTIMNSAPTNAQVSVTSSNAFYNDSTLTCSMTADDLDVVDGTDTLTYTYAWSTGDTGADLVLSGSLVPTTDITCTATATDSSGASVSGTATETLGNRAPTVDSISLPASATATTTSLLCSATASDLDGTTPSLSYVWTIDGNPLTETSDTLTGPFVYGEVIGCTAFADDGISTGTASTSVSISNTAPTVDSVALTPATVYTNDTITATVLVSDIDTAQVGSLTANYEWFVDGASVQNGASNTLDGVSMFNRDQDVYVVVTANDGLEYGTPVQSSAITVSNAAPVISSVTVTPDPATAGQDDLVCDVVATDADGDAIVYTYEWSDSNGVQQTTTEVPAVSDTFLAAGLAEDTWTCEVTPYDGTDYGAMVSDSVTVESGCWSLEFGQNGQLIIPNDSSFDVGNTLTLSSWVYLYDYGPNNISIFNNGVSSGYHPSYKLGINGDRYGIEYQGFVNFYANIGTSESPVTSGNSPLSGDFGVWSNTPLSLHSWYHIALVYDVSTIKIYINGVEDVSVAANGGDLYVPIHDLWIGDEDGNSTTAQDWYLPGYLQNLGIWNRALTPTEIEQIVQSGSQSNSGLIALWNLDEGQGGTAFDTSGNNHNGTINGATWVNSCPEEDLDGDGVAAWEDCDDGDANFTTYCPVSSALAEFKFDEGSGQVLNDSSGNGYSGQLGETTGVDSSDPAWNSGYLTFSGDAFNGSGPRPGTCLSLDVPYAEHSELSFQMVVRGASQTNQIRLMKVRWSSNGYSQLSPWGDNIRIEHQNSSNYYTGTLLDNNWHVLSYTRDSFGNFTLYIDDQLDITGVHVQPSGSTTNWILGGANCNDDPFNGDIAYMFVYDSALSQNEILQNYDFLQYEMSQRSITLP